MESHSEETDGGIGAVEMTGRIRDERYEQVKDMAPVERLEYNREESAEAPRMDSALSTAWQVRALS